MNDDSCSCDGCAEDVTYRTYPVLHRAIHNPAQWCIEHWRVFLDSYKTHEHVGEASGLSTDNCKLFDVELLVIDSQPDGQCHLFLHEVGGAERLDCPIGLFESAALLRQLQHLDFPRPLTHHAMIAAISELGGEPQSVVIDSYYPEVGIYTSKITIRQKRKTRLLDLRPSDAIVLAVICDIPIYAHKSVLLGD